MNVRQLTPADAPIYREFRLRGLREHPDAFTSSFEEEAARSLEVTEQRLAAGGDTCILGAFEGDALAGAVGLTRETRRKAAHRGTVVAMYVQPEFARRGVGRTLVDAIIAHARTFGLEQLVLTVTATNVHARRLYASAGFASFGVEPRAINVDGVYYDKEHMTLRLGDD